MDMEGTEDMRVEAMWRISGLVIGGAEAENFLESEDWREWAEWSREKVEAEWKNFEMHMVTYKGKMYG